VWVSGVTSREIVHDEDQPMVVVAVEDLNVHSGLGHPPAQRTELTRDSLHQLQDDHVTFLMNETASRFESVARCHAVLKQKMSDAGPADNPRASTLDADPGAAQRLTHFGQRAGSVFKGDC
jgi:hypothetical protein